MACLWHYSVDPLITCDCMCMWESAGVRSRSDFPFFESCDWQQQTSVWLKMNSHWVKQTGSVKVTAEDISMREPCPGSTSHLSGHKCIQSLQPEFHKSIIWGQICAASTPHRSMCSLWLDCSWVSWPCVGGYMYIYYMCSELGLVQNVRILGGSELLRGIVTMEKKVFPAWGNFWCSPLNSVSSDNEYGNSNSSPKYGVAFTQA